MAYAEFDATHRLYLHRIRCWWWHRRGVEMSRVFTAAMIEAYCPECAELEAFEQPPCVDGHGADCPEWLCLTCGTALLIDAPVEPVVERLPRTSSSRAA